MHSVHSCIHSSIGKLRLSFRCLPISPVHVSYIILYLLKVQLFETQQESVAKTTEVQKMIMELICMPKDL